jgi:hypothetical protein
MSSLGRRFRPQKREQLFPVSRACSAAPARCQLRQLWLVRAYTCRPYEQASAMRRNPGAPEGTGGRAPRHQPLRQHWDARDILLTAGPLSSGERPLPC